MLKSEERAGRSKEKEGFPDGRRAEDAVINFDLYWEFTTVIASFAHPGLGEGGVGTREER